MAVLTRHEGMGLLSAGEAMLKGALEAEIEIAIIAAPRLGTFSSVFDLALMPPSGAAVTQLLRQHNVRLLGAPDAARAVTLAGYTARSGRAGLALVPNDQLDEAISAISRALAAPLDRGGTMCLVLEDSPRESPASCPRQAAQRLNLPCIEPTDIDQLRDSIEHALRLSRASRGLIGIVVHNSILRSADTLELRPNRISANVEAVLAKRKRHRAPRWSEAGGVLRMARRLELNRFRAMPSPGERVGVGFITVGPADQTMLHIANVLGLFGRVPVLQLGLIHPVDESAVGRLLARCQRVIVLEPRPGTLEMNVIAVAEDMRRNGEQPASVWGRLIPADSNGAKQSLTGDDDLHPSVLVRKISHLLHSIRPTIQVASQLLPDPPPLIIPPMAQRDAQIGSSAALALVRRIVTDVDQWLRDRAPLQERGVSPTALAIDGAEAAGITGRIVTVETWEHRRFQHDGIAALVQASRDDRPWIMLACEVASEEIRDLERLARGAIPAERADRVSLQVANLADRVALRDLIREAALVDRVTVIIVHDGPPAHYDVSAIEQSLAEIDRLGFEPRQRLMRSADEMCAIRPPIDEADQEQRLEHDPSPLKTQFTVDELSKRVGSKFRLRVRPLLEEVEVVRTRPPVRSWRGDASLRLTTPQAAHARQAQWRAHLAGFRRDAPGLAAWVLCEAGRLMGYHVRAIHDPTPIGAGRRAWTQVLFTRPRENEAPLPMTGSIPYGEADLLLGLDAREMLRAIGPDPSLRVAFDQRTHVVGNVGAFGEEIDGEAPEVAGEQIAAAVAAVSRSEGRLLNDFAGACRAWFHTDRVADMALLGAAFQLGLVPVSPEAIESAIGRLEDRGFGRCHESFEFGRRLAVDPRLFSKPKDDQEEDVDRLARRIVLSLSRGEWGGGPRARNFSQLIHQSLQSMPGLAETDPGRAARRDFVVACHRCRIWGGFEYAQQYAGLITRLYQVDRGDTGRALTRNAVLPLAEAMLVRDPLYVASMATSSEQRRRMRHRLNVKQARGDRIERRYLTRFELVAFNRRMRADVRSSDWPARAVATFRKLMPYRWRGTRRERELREYLIGFIKRAIDGAGSDYEGWADAMQRLHLQAMENRLRGMALAEVRMLVEPGATVLSATTRPRGGES